jgi:hypothetical protein
VADNPEKLFDGGTAWDRASKAFKPGCFGAVATGSIKNMFVKLLAGGREAQRMAQLCSEPLRLAGKGTYVGAGSQAEAASGGDGITALHHPLPLPDLSVRPLGYLDPEAVKGWMAGHPGMYQFTQEGYVGVKQEVVCGLAKHNSYVAGVPVRPVIEDSWSSQSPVVTPVQHAGLQQAGAAAAQVLAGSR